MHTRGASGSHLGLQCCQLLLELGQLRQPLCARFARALLLQLLRLRLVKRLQLLGARDALVAVLFLLVELVGLLRGQAPEEARNSDLVRRDEIVVLLRQRREEMWGQARES